MVHVLCMQEIFLLGTNKGKVLKKHLNCHTGSTSFRDLEAQRVVWCVQAAVCAIHLTLLLSHSIALSSEEQKRQSRVALGGYQSNKSQTLLGLHAALQSCVILGHPPLVSGFLICKVRHLEKKLCFQGFHWMVSAPRLWVFGACHQTLPAQDDEESAFWRLAILRTTGWGVRGLCTFHCDQGSWEFLLCPSFWLLTVLSSGKPTIKKTLVFYCRTFDIPEQTSVCSLNPARLSHQLRFVRICPRLLVFTWQRYTFDKE